MRKILLEGGNVWPDTTDFDHKQIPEIVQAINQALSQTGARAFPVGSAATPTPGKRSGDLDVIVDERAIVDFFKAKDAKTARKALSEFFQKAGFETAQSGINVHVKVPSSAGKHQVDIMVTPNAERVAKFHTHAIPAGSPYKGINKQLMMAILAKSKGYMWSAWQGLYTRNAEGKKDQFVTDDLDRVAEVLLGTGTSAKNLGSVEAIMAALPNDQAQALLDQARKDPNWYERPVQESTGNWYRDMLNKLGL